MLKVSLAEVCLRPGGSRRLRGEAFAELAQQVPVLPGVLYYLGPGRRFGAKAPRHQPGAGRAGPRCHGPLPAAGGPVPGPDGGLGHNGGDCGYPFERPRGPGPVKGQKDQLHPGPAVITSHPGIVAPAAGVRQAPGLPLPGRCRPAGSGRRYSGPAASALAPVAHLFRRHLLAGPRGPRHLLVPGAEVPAPGTQARTLVIPSGTSSTGYAGGMRFPMAAAWTRRSVPAGRRCGWPRLIFRTHRARRGDQRGRGRCRPRARPEHAHGIPAATGLGRRRDGRGDP